MMSACFSTASTSFPTGGAAGYCIDDNALRALMLVHLLPARGRNWRNRARLSFASFLQHGWNPDRGVFRNFMGYDRRWLEDEGSEDSNGRTLWALGHAAAHAASPAMRDWAADLFDLAAPMAERFKSPRAIASRSSAQMRGWRMSRPTPAPGRSSSAAAHFCARCGNRRAGPAGTGSRRAYPTTMRVWQRR